ncbi:MAG: nucleotidyltransferase domain-containing protein [Acidobacteria bacterium]|nr:nucleotidyltransferase domain-containing protein [Acidobacteriota bacterium]
MYTVEVDEAKLEEIVRRIVEVADPDRIILFGSRARGDVRMQSDVDLLVVKDSSLSHYKRVGPLYVSLFGIDVPIDILWYTPTEVAQWAGAINHVIARALREGRVLYERRN